MKKIILVALSAVVAFSLCGCTVMESLGFVTPDKRKELEAKKAKETKKETAPKSFYDWH